MKNPRTWVITLRGDLTPENFNVLSVADRKGLALGFRHAHEAVAVTSSLSRTLCTNDGDKMYIVHEVKK